MRLKKFTDVAPHVAYFFLYFEHVVGLDFSFRDVISPLRKVRWRLLAG